MNLQKKIKLLRKNKKYTQLELANKLGVYRNNISSWENGNSYPDVKMIEKICDHFNISMKDFLNENKGIRSKKEKVMLSIYMMLPFLLILIFLFISFYNSIITNINANEIKIVKVQKIPVKIRKKIYNKLKTEKDYKYYVYVHFKSAFKTFESKIPSIQCDSYKKYTTASFKAKHSLNIFKNLKQNNSIQRLEIPTYAEDDEGSLNKGKNICIVTNDCKPQKKYIILPSNKNH
ncbi:helix-turn-helix transcriptional regulator [Apilactobacillus xinyiensis]|uniref:helix-turn-helix transcriptional regulator n=1 Tax=Apilactobacillus xinyiensis TaxID=2841032 RepID=UPI00200F3154|nr:helix-turn-helix transcriptional regulator [Apilactobacillus xinyiensis]MCL0330071.1 helix-turn-helix domain-containing protein [Apilactobacillus xinyiensis]